MNNLIVYCEIEDGIVADVSLELLTKGRSLANQLGCQLEAVVAGTGFSISSSVNSPIAYMVLMRWVRSARS